MNNEVGGATKQAATAVQRLARAAKRTGATIEVAAKRTGNSVRSAVDQTLATVDAYRPSDEQLALLKSAAKKGSVRARDAALALGKDVVASTTFKRAAAGAGVGAIVAVPLPLVGPMVGALVGAGVGVYVDMKSGHSAPKGAEAPQVVELVTTPIKDLPQLLRSLQGLKEEGLLSAEEFDTLKKRLLETASA